MGSVIYKYPGGVYHTAQTVFECCPISFQTWRRHYYISWCTRM
jgi:hypothetical protein